MTLADVSIGVAFSYPMQVDYLRVNCHDGTHFLPTTTECDEKEGVIELLDR
jgi:hypothetical protein